MDTPENPAVVGLVRIHEMIEKRDALALKVFETLRSEYMSAARLDPLKPIPTPGWAPGHDRFINVFYDAFAGRSGDALLERLVGLLTTTKTGMAFLEELATDYARFHWSDALANELESNQP